MALMFPCYMRGISVEADVSTFFPTDETMQRIYGKVWPSIALVFDHMIPFKSIPQLSFFGQIDWLGSKGCSLIFHQRTHIECAPLTAGFKWIQTINQVAEWYFGLAPKYYFMRIKNYSRYVPSLSHQHGCGGFITTGFFLYPIEHCLVNLFLNYSYMKFDAPCSTDAYTGFCTKVSGFNLGGGVGWKF